MAVIGKAHIYSLHPSFAHWSAMLKSLQARTGKDIRQWQAELTTSNASTPTEQRVLLKAHGLGSATVDLILNYVAGRTPENYDPQSLVDHLFRGPRTALLPLYEAVLHFALGLGSDVKASPCATMVPLYRRHVFAQLKPATKSRLNLSLALRKVKFSAPESTSLIETGGLARQDRITHRLELSTPTDFNDFAKDFLLRAYRADEPRGRLPK